MGERGLGMASSTTHKAESDLNDAKWKVLKNKTPGKERLGRRIEDGRRYVLDGGSRRGAASESELGLPPNVIAGSVRSRMFPQGRS